jgi:hypothetical protein
MIRDPSDGTVNEINPDANKINAVVPKTRSEGIDTGLRQPTRTDAQVRMEKSRDWLKDYRARQANPQKSEETSPSGLPD